VPLFTSGGLGLSLKNSVLFTSILPKLSDSDEKAIVALYHNIMYKMHSTSRDYERTLILILASSPLHSRRFWDDLSPSPQDPRRRPSTDAARHSTRRNLFRPIMHYLANATVSAWVNTEERKLRQGQLPQDGAWYLKSASYLVVLPCQIWRLCVDLTVWPYVWGRVRMGPKMGVLGLHRWVCGHGGPHKTFAPLLWS